MIALAVILPAAGAILPDPLWIAGVYDGGDADDLVAVSAEFYTPGITPPLLDRSAVAGTTSLRQEAGPLIDVNPWYRPRAPPPRPDDRAVQP
jgi:hypothetical protein